MTSGMFFLSLAIQTALPAFVIYTMLRRMRIAQCHRDVMLWAGVIWAVVGVGCFTLQTMEGWHKVNGTRDFWRMYLLAADSVLFLGFRIATRRPLSDRRACRTHEWQKKAHHA